MAAKSNDISNFFANAAMDSAELRQLQYRLQVLHVSDGLLRATSVAQVQPKSLDIRTCSETMVEIKQKKPTAFKASNKCNKKIENCSMELQQSKLAVAAGDTPKSLAALALDSVELRQLQYRLQALHVSEGILYSLAATKIACAGTGNKPAKGASQASLISKKAETGQVRERQATKCRSEKQRGQTEITGKTLDALTALALDSVELRQLQYRLQVLHISEGSYYADRVQQEVAENFHEASNFAAAAALDSVELRQLQYRLQLQHVEEAATVKQNQDQDQQISRSKRKRLKQREKKNNFLAMDCEMVGVGPKGVNHMLARVSIVNRNGEVMLDKYVKPQEPVTNFRTAISGIRPLDMENGEDFNTVQDEVVNLVNGKIIIGHGLDSDFKVLRIRHPTNLIRDTSNYKPYRRMGENGHKPALRVLSKKLLQLNIQEGEHDSVEDARVAMRLYSRVAKVWEESILQRQYKHAAPKGKARRHKR